jgi:hypothetical protein
MPRKPIELPPAVARDFLADKRAFFAETSSIKKDEIAARQAWLLNQHLGPGDKKLRVADVRGLFLQMKDGA